MRLVVILVAVTSALVSVLTTGPEKPDTTPEQDVALFV